MNTELDGKRALVTGGASGIGRAIANALAAEGARVIIGDVDAAAGQTAATEITGRGLHARAVHCDVTKESSVVDAIANVRATEGALDLMVNNAGIGGALAPLTRSQADDWDRVYAVNLRGVFFGIKHAANAMPDGGCIVNIASIAGLRGSSLLGPYGATKAAVIQLTQTAALELAKQHIRVNAICPGWIDTPMLQDLERARLVRQIPLGRIGEPAEVAGLVVYLASSAATFVTGSILRVDGGIAS